jgi:hypothetical protein
LLQFNGLGHPVLFRFGEGTRISREKSAPADVTKLEKEEDDTLETCRKATGKTQPKETLTELRTDTSTTVRWAALSEAIDVILHDIRVDAAFLHSLLQERRLVDTLPTRQDLLATDEKVAGVGALGIVWIRHGVKRSGRSREFVYSTSARDNA